MGYFTWTLTDTDKELGYGCLNKPHHLLIPQEFGGGSIRFTYYEGYGLFGTNEQDVYELIADWNKGAIMDAFPDWWKNWLWLPCKGFEKVIKAFDKGGDKAAIKILKSIPDAPAYLFDEWKRNIGITIACRDEDHEKCKYKIRFTDKQNVAYEDFIGFSHSQQ